jgi:hypothetical protein
MSLLQGYAFYLLHDGSLLATFFDPEHGGDVLLPSFMNVG